MRNGMLLAGLTMLAAAGAAGQGDGAPAEQGPVMSPASTAVELTLGLKDKSLTDWSGQVSVSPGKVVSVAPLPGGEPTAGPVWKLSTRPGPVRGKKKAAGPPQPVRLRVLLQAPATATVRVATAQGAFSFVLSEVAMGADSEFLNGAASARRVPAAWQITTTPTDDDFPAAAAGPDGAVWCAYASYERGTPIDDEAVRKGSFDSLIPKGNGDRVRLMRCAGGQWSAAMDVTDGGLDVWRPSVAVDAAGTVWVFWSQQVEGNWDVCCRSYDPAKKAWAPVRRLTKAPGTDACVVAAAAPGQAGAWIAWQGWRPSTGSGQGGGFDILLARVTADGVGPEHRVSTSGGNDWQPAIAVSPAGEVWVAWDTYDKGDYDVYVRRLAGGKLDAPVAVAASQRYEARPAIAIDGKGRVWIAFEDADANWAKDYGPRLTGRGVPFYLERNILVRCLQGGQVRQTKAAPRSERIQTFFDDKRYKTELRHRISFPRLGVDNAGNLWLLFRRHPLVNAAGEQWISLATYLDGDRWAPELRLPDSRNLLDSRPATAPLKDAGLLAVYSSDQRTNARNAQVCNLHAAVFRADKAPAEPVLTAAAVEGGGPVEPVHPKEAEQVRRLRDYRVTVGGKTYVLARGEFHRHTEISSHRDWDGALEAVWRYGHDVADMDWIGPGDHDYGVGHDYIWWLTQKQIDLFHHAPELVTMFTYERSVSYPSGHRNVMFARRGIRPVSRMTGRDEVYGTPEAGAPDIQNLFAYVKHFGGICSSHTSATSMGTDWRDGDPVAEPVVEIFQGHRQNYEEPKAPLAATGPADSIQGYKLDGFVWQALIKGRRLGFQSGSDHVSTHTSYGVVFVEQRSREGVLDGFKRRHCYAANDNILLDVRCGEGMMGDVIPATDAPTLKVLAHGTVPIRRVDVIRQLGNQTPMYVYNLTPNAEKVEFQWTDRAARPGQQLMYYVRIQQQDERLAWASPIWVRR